MTITLDDAIRRTGVDVLEHLDRQAEVPVLAGPQRQGDLIIVPQRAGADRGQPVPAEGVPVIHGEAGGNTHLLIADGAVSWRPVAPQAGVLDIGTVTVNEDAVAFLAHPEHGYLGMAPGVYGLRRQREQADAVRMVQD